MPTEPATRAYAGADDLRRMQDLLIRDFARAETRIGDLAWRTRLRDHHERALELTLWEHGGELIAWTWLRSNGGCDLYVAGPHRDDTSLWERMLDRVESQAESWRRAGDPLEELYTWFAGDLELVEPSLVARGFCRFEEEGGMILVCDDLRLAPRPRLPPGYSLDSLDEKSVAERVELHRAAFAPSNLTLEAYRRVRHTWPYEPTLDRLVRSAAGDAVAACTAWLDERNHAGLLEPVATHPDHHNRGLARAIVADALSCLAAAGAMSAQVGTSGPAAQAAYVAAGFAPWRQEVTFRKRLASVSNSVDA